MAADMYASMLWLPAGTEPDWDAAIAKADQLRFRDGENNGDMAFTDAYSDVAWEVQEARKMDRDHDPDHHLRGIVRGQIRELKNAVDGDDRELAEYRMYGWRIFVTGTFGDEPTELGKLIEDLNTLELLQVAGFNPALQQVEVITHSHKHGVDTSVHQPGTAEEHMAEIARQNWDEINHRADVPDHAPEDDLEAVQIYSDHQTNGGFLGCDQLPVVCD